MEILKKEGWKLNEKIFLGGHTFWRVGGKGDNTWEYWKKPGMVGTGLGSDIRKGEKGGYSWD